MTRYQFLLLIALVACLTAAWLLYQHGRQPSRQAPPQHQPLPPATPPEVPAAAPGALPLPLPPAEPPTAFIPPPLQSEHILLGNPSDARADPANHGNYLMVKPYYTVAYDDATGELRWVGWRVTAADLGTAPRKRTFDPDDELPPGFRRVVTRDYAGSGFDRGRMGPHSDRAATIESSYATFVMSNIIPQAPNLNQKAWEHVEDWRRQQVNRHYNRLYVVSGPWGQGGVGSKGPADAIAGGRVVVPARCWKVIVAVHETGRDDLAAATAATHVLAVDMPKDNATVGDAWLGYRCSVAVDRGKTGLHFFGRLPPAVRDILRQQVQAGRTE